MLRRPYPSIAGAGHVQFWSASSIVTFLKQEANLEIVNRHQDLLDEDIDSGSSNGHGGRVFLKQALRNWLPGPIYSRLLTTHSTFLCRKPVGPT
jgi:hypothetical protein